MPVKGANGVERRTQTVLEPCGVCEMICPAEPAAIVIVPHVLEVTVKGRAAEENMGLGPDCTRCGLCVDTCPTGALRFEVKGLSKLL
jgi:formate hydrogenlyase subunit 6/NADH:ubiquinone oxidoreductase subunit I